MLTHSLAALAAALLSPATMPATPPQDAAAMIASAESAGPESVTASATIRDWAGNVLREGDNGWVCLPDRPDTPGAEDPWCVDATWLEFIDAWANQREPNITSVGIAYMLAGDAPVSNTDPYATEPTEEGDWVTGVPAHIMVVLPDTSHLAGISTEHENGGPWIMWPDTPYAHIMIPIDAYYGGGHMEHMDH
jgi:hypothetical protein